MQLLKVENIETYIEQFHILQGVSFELLKGEVTVLLGRNGAGKTTTLRSIMGLNPINKGNIFFEDKSISKLTPYEVARRGIGYVVEDQGIFPSLTVEENMKVAMQKNDDETMERKEWILDLLPDLKTYWKKDAGTLSGGQKQMLAIARVLINENKLLLIDEPSKGLAPIIVEKIIEILQQIKEKTPIVLVEQNFYMASKIGDRFYIIDNGQTVYNGKMEEIIEDIDLRKKYLGVT